MAAFVFVLLSAHAACAQFTRFENFSDGSGLGNASVSAIGQDANGFILLGTDAGLYRYDGSLITPLDAGDGLPTDAWVRSITVDRQGWVWVVTTDSLYVRRADRYASVETGAALKLFSPHLFARLDSGVVLDNGGALLEAPVGPRGAGRFSPLLSANTLKAVPALADARFVVADGTDALLAGCGTGLCRIEGGRVERYGEEDGLAADAWQVAARASDGTLWVRSLDRIAWRRQGERFFHVLAVPGRRGQLNVAVPSRLDLLPDGASVLTEGDEGLLEFNGKSWRAFRHHGGGLSASPIESMMFDREGSLWLGSLGHGAFRSLGWGSWEHWTAEDGLPSDIVWSAARPTGGPLWVATYGDAVPLDGSAPGLPGGSENVQATRGGRLWFAPLRAPLARFDRTTGRVDRVPLAGSVASTLLDGRNRLWVATDKGLLVIPDADAPADRLRLTVALTGSVSQATTDLAGRIWALSDDGLHRQAADGVFRAVPAPLPAGQGLDGMAFAANGDLWVVTDSAGIVRLRPRDGRFERLPSIAAPLIASNNILFVYRDRRGFMWVGTDHGIDVLREGRWRHLDIDDGLISNDLDQWAVYEDADGSMWFGSSRGLSHLRDPAHLPAQDALHPVVTGVSMGRNALKLAPSIRIDWSAAPLVIRFVDLDFTRGHNVTFRYRLAGVDTGWNDTTAHEVRYARLPAGRLRFELMAVDNAHHALSAPIGFTLKVRAPWWRRWWFYALCVLLTGAAIAGAWFARVRLLLMQRRRLEAVVSQRTAEIEQARLELQRLAMVDPLTGLPNRRAIMGTLETAIAASLASGEAMAVLLCDLDHFRRLNEALGHLAGDAILAEFGTRLKAALRGAEAAGRYGGEEFCVLLPGGLAAIAERVAAIRSAVSDAPYVSAEGGRTVTTSGGLAFLQPGDGALSLLSRADAALQRAKQEGRNRIAYEESAAEEAARTADGSPKSASSQRAELERDLRLALRDHQFSLHYQPVLDIRRNVVTSCEALLRWHSPTRGRVSPVEFIPFAEQIGLMPQISHWVLRTACREAATWPERIVVSVNLSAVQLRTGDLVEQVEAALAESGLDPQRLELEVTETAMITEAAVASAMLDRLRALGIKVALDDFGTGYSSLSFLRTLPFDRIKIDRSFVQDLGIKREASVIVRAIAGMCESLGASVTAEGVETDAQVEALRAAGCSELQGYRISRPCPPAELRVWMAEFARRPVLEVA